MKISIGPNLFFWEKQRTYDFYDKLLTTEADVIYLGETVCAKRRELKTDDWLDLAVSLKQNSNKEIVVSTLSIIESQAELGQVKRICANNEIWVEANDIAAVDECINLNIPFVTGPAVNIYNDKTLSFLYKKGLRRWVAPVEISGEKLADIIHAFNKANPNNLLETELFSWGMMPLAFSARCYSSRVKKLSKDRCNFNCIEDPDGIPVNSQENDTIFNINGIQTQSGKILNLLPYLKEIEAAGVDIMRISPQTFQLFENVKKLKDKIKAPDKEVIFDTENSVDGYWFNKAGFEKIKESAF